MPTSDSVTTDKYPAVDNHSQTAPSNTALTVPTTGWYSLKRRASNAIIDAAHKAFKGTIRSTSASSSCISSARKFPPMRLPHPLNRTRPNPGRPTALGTVTINKHHVP